MEMQVLENNGVVRNYDRILEIFTDRLGGNYVSIYDLESILEKGIDIYYFDDNATNATQVTYDEPETGLKIIQTRATDARSGLPLCLSFYRKDKQNLWEGCFVGIKPYLFKKHFGMEEQTTERINQAEASLREIYNSLFDKEIWDINGNLDYLKDYLIVIKKKIESDIKKKNNKSYILNVSETKILFNSRLTDTFDNYIHLIADYRYGVIGQANIVNNLRELESNGFERRMLNIEPTEFFESLDDIFFRGDVDEFDFTNPRALNHVINERRDRMPESLREKSSVELTSLLKAAVQRGITMSKVDCRFVVPMYNPEHDKIQFLMPIYFGIDNEYKPHNALIIDRDGKYWGIRTIIGLREAYVNARVLGDPCVRWLSVM